VVSSSKALVVTGDGDKGKTSDNTSMINTNDIKEGRLGPQLWKNDLGEGVEMTPRTARSNVDDDTSNATSNIGVDYKAMARQRPQASIAKMQSLPSTSMKRVGGGFAQTVANGEPNASTSNGPTAQLPAMEMSSQQDLVNAITVALQSALPSILSKAGGSDVSTGATNQNLIGLGLGLGLGLGMRQQMAAASPTSAGPVQTSNDRSMLDSHDGTEADEIEDESIFTEDIMQKEPVKESSALALMLTPTPDTIENDTHEPAGKDVIHHRLSKEDKILPLVKAKPDLPENFLTAVFEPHVGRQHVDYLPNEPNTNEASYCAAVRPRNMMEDWLETGFDPWAEGRDATATDFRKHLPGEDSDEEANPFADTRGKLDQKLKVEADAKVSQIMDQIMSLTRHGRYEEIDNIISAPDFVHSIDSRDSKGNTLLIAAAQNGNKRIAKLALRKGADINLQNLAGQTPLHFSFAYGYEDLGNYLISKGADDSITNAEGLTCYEGISLKALDDI
jgi:hypothetical protein